MNVNTLRPLFSYNRWANERILGAVERLTPEQFTRDLGSSHKSVRDTLAHTYSALWVWLSRWRGTSPTSHLPISEFATIEQTRVRGGAIEKDLDAFVQGVTDASLIEKISYKNYKGVEFRQPLWEMMLHVVNHSTYHRGQVTTLLRQLGAQPIETDLIVYFRNSA
jgi:uncharacterized damage-inducible protein DinB